ncbi:hypothetical protein TWF192_001454 [Orbilia oligospora]|uniref:DNA replication regulator Sld3 C-terminal domain-containing protein n=1 Tax=Orbilia oligospora TaxID=2813651 RepID=A0A6G1MFQ3_ORBOL|nr:hypothetical protein TWF191_000846 [Orbilia oligospora]KAF3257179.1 hypothetical protein TWF192_001454 [Orbilia oligospora]
MDGPPKKNTPLLDAVTFSTPRHLKKGPVGSALSLRKRRRADDGITVHLPPPFTIEAESDFGENVHIKPLEILPRDSIGLDWANSKTNSRLFNADIPSLNAENVILIAKYDNTRQLAAIQRVGHPRSGLYTLFRLSNHVNMGPVKTMAAHLKKEIGKWWKPAELDDDGAQSEPEEWWEDGNMDQSILVNALQGVHVTPGSRQLNLDKLLTVTKSLAIAKNKPALKPKICPLPSGPAPPSNTDSVPEFGLARLRQQYYSLLYTSKSSLQYFPKTSLSRARVLFPTNGESPVSRLDLLLCLENMVMSVEECDDKYRAGIRDVSNARRAQSGMADQMTNDQLESTIVPPNCLRDNEIKYVLKWLKSLSDDDGPIRSLEQEEIHLQKCTTELRSRETELQVIVILEILAIKEGEEPKSSQPKPKDAKDRLRHFCIEIVIAYYSSRLPNICEDIRCKCTGKIKQTRKDHDLVIEGDETQLDISQIESQGAMPDTTEDSSLFSKSVYGSRPTLSRSLTAPAGRPQLERAESSFSASLHGETQDLTFDFAAQVSQDKEAMKTSFRGGITNTKKTAERRVVDMAPRTKRRKTECDDESQLKDAIKNIAKPNRLAVAEEMVSASAQRMKITGRKPKKTIRIPVATNTVQVAATPRKNNRTLKLLDRKPDVPTAIAEEEDYIPPSSQIVPQSSIKDARKNERDEVQATPSKAPRADAHARTALHQHDAQRLNLLQSSPLCISATPMRTKRTFMESLNPGTSSKPNAFISSTPSNPFRTSTDTYLAKGFMNSITSSVTDTPTKPSISSKLRSSLLQIDEGDVITSSPLQKPKPGTPVNRRLVVRNIEEDFGNDDTDIYKALGWNDY